jgi:hypothetical protein
VANEDNQSKVGNDSVVYGNVQHRNVGDRSVVVGPTDAKGDTILRPGPGGIAIGAGAKAGPYSLSIGAGAGAGANPTGRPTTKTGSFIPAGNTFDAFKAVQRVFEGAKTDILIVDPYLDEKFLTKFALLAPSGVPLRLLTDSGSHRPSLIPAITHFKNQYGNNRPIEARGAPARSLHDRMVAIDCRHIWTVGQSFNALATRAPTSFVEVDQETAAPKMAAYEAIWATATPILAHGPAN